MRDWKRLAITGVKISIGLALLVISLVGVNWGALHQSLQSVSIGWLLLTLLSMLFTLGLKVWRWQMLLSNFGVAIRLQTLVGAFFVGQAANIIIPARGGDVVRVGIASTDSPENTAQIVISIALEKFLDLLVLLLVGAGVSAYLPPDKSQWIQTWLLPVSVLGVVGLVVIALAGPALWKTFRERIPFQGWTPTRWGMRFVDRLVASSVWLRESRQVIRVLAMTVVIWGSMWATNMLLFKSMALPINSVAGGLVLVLGYLGVLPALMPGNVGPFYFFANLALQPFNIPKEAAVAYTTLLHATIILPPLIIGGLISLLSGRGSQFGFRSWTQIKTSPTPAQPGEP